MSEKERIKVLSAIVDNEAKLFAIDLPASGSVFYDISLKFWFEERSALEIGGSRVCYVSTAVDDLIHGIP